MTDNDTGSLLEFNGDAQTTPMNDTLLHKKHNFLWPIIQARDINGIMCDVPALPEVICFMLKYKLIRIWTSSCLNVPIDGKLRRSAFI